MKYFLLFFFLFLIPFVLAEPCQENQQRSCGTSDVGACSYGVQICQHGQWSVCYGNTDPTSEQCNNNLDDNCDGQVDEGCFCVTDAQRACDGAKVGICQPGYQTCVNGTEWSSCFNQTAALANDLCDNNLDDDCDGQVDEGCGVQTNTTQQQTNCFNAVQDGDETGIDCGGSCRTCTTCTDGILNQGEYKTAVDLGASKISDCGGPNCPSCPMCTDGVQNQKETGIDCGGPCQVCQQIQEPVVQNPVSVCGDSVCQSDETATTCPQDCKSASSNSLITIVVVLFLLFLVIGVYLWWQFKRGTKKIPQKTAQTQQPEYISKTLLNQTTGKQQQSKLDADLDKSLEKVEKFLK